LTTAHTYPLVDLSRIVKELDETVDGLDDTLGEIQARADEL
jgi:hypothetical protein